MNVGSLNPNTDKWDEILKAYWNSIPYWTKRISVIALCLELLSFFSDTSILINFPIRTLFKLQFYAIFTTSFVHLGIINLIISLLVFTPRASGEEFNLGSQMFIWDFFTKNVVMQLIFTFIMLPVCFGVPNTCFYASAGLWNIALIYISQGSFKFPDHVMQLWCFPIKITHIWYPPILLILFMVLSGGVLFDLIISYLFAYLEFKFFKCSLYEYPVHWYNCMISCRFCRKFGMKPVEQPFQQNESDRSINTINSSTSSIGNFQQYSGKGIAIGETDFDSPKPILDDEADIKEEKQDSLLNENDNNEESNDYFCL